MTRFPKLVSIFMLFCLVIGLACKEAATKPTPVPATATLVGLTSKPVPPTPTPIMVIDDLGRTVTVKGVPQRIVSLAPSNTEILFALGLDKEIVGVTDFCDYPPEAKGKASVGAPFPEFSLEKIVALNPDLAVAFGYTLPDVASKLETQGIPVIVLGAKTVDGVIADIELVGKVAGREAKAKELTSAMRKRIEAVTAKTKSVPKPSVYYEMDATDPTKPWTAGPGSLIDDLIRLAGGENIGAKGSSSAFQIGSEEILKANPQIIIFASAQYGVAKADLKKRTGWEAIAAVKEDAVYPVDATLADLIEVPGPRIAEGMEKMAQMIHPELF